MKKILLMLSTNIGIKIISTIYGILLARVLGPDLKGEYAIALLIPSFLISFFDFGVGQGAVYYYRRGVYSIQKTVSSVLVFAITIGLLIVFVLLLCLPALQRIFPVVHSDTIFIVAILYFPFLLIQQYVGLLVLSVGHIKTYNIIMLFKELAYLLFILYIYLNVIQNLNVILIAYVAINSISIISMFCVLLRKNTFKISMISFEAIKEYIKYGYKISLLSIVNYLHYKSDLYLVSLFLTAGDVGIYSLSISLAEMLWIIPNSSSNLLFIDEATKSEKIDSIDKTRLNAKILFYIVIVCGVLLALIGYPAIKYIYSEKFIESFIPLLILIPGNISFSLFKMFGNMVAANGNPEKLVIASLIAAIINIILNIIVIPRVGIIGAALVSTLTYSLAAIIILKFYAQIKRLTIKNTVMINQDEFAFVKEQFSIWAKRWAKNHA